jgi:mRNA-degrading endonuclease toxin of MazEF toxin-antitoxin module
MDVFDRGDVVSVPLDPAIGHEQKDTQPTLVLTTKTSTSSATCWSPPSPRAVTSRATRASQ